MKLLIGLGNRGKKYARTRHNAGFLALDQIDKKGKFESWRREADGSLVTFGSFKGKDFVLFKPGRLMNLSGPAVVEFMRKNGKTSWEVWIVHDDSDLPLGVIRLQTGWHRTSHKGLQSIVSALRTTAFLRFRLGIGSEKTKSRTDFVLEEFTPKEWEVFRQSLDSWLGAVALVLRKGTEVAMQAINKASRKE